MSNDDSLQSSERDEVLRILTELELIDVHCSQFKIEHIAAGAINRNFQVSDQSTSVLLKLFSQSQSLPVDRNAIFQLQMQLAIVGMAPKPLLLNENNSIYLEQWIEDLQHHQSVANNPLAISSLAEALYSIHNAYIVSAELALETHWQYYWQQITAPSIDLVQMYEFMRTQYREYQQQYKSEFVLCHNDLNIDHVCTNSGLIIDWEYAATGCRYFDIACCVSINKLDNEQTYRLCATYAQLSNQNADEVLQRVQNMFKFVSFTNKLWANSVGLEAIE